MPTSIDARLAALSVPDLNRVVAALPDADPAEVLQDVNRLQADLITAGKTAAAALQMERDIRAAIERAKALVAGDIPHLWTAGEIADAMQECGL